MLKLGDVSSHECFGHRSGGKSVAWNSQGTKLASCSSDKTAKIWSVVGEGKGREVANLSGHVASVDQILWSTEDILITSSQDKTVRLWDARVACDTGTSSSCSVARISLPSAPVHIDLHPNGTALAVLLMEEHQQKQNYALRVYDIRKRNLAVSGTVISTSTGSSTGSTTNLQPVRSYSSLYPKSSSGEQLNQGKFSPFGYHYITASKNNNDGYGKLHIMDLSDETNDTSTVHTLVAHGGSANCFSFSSGGRYMATGGSDSIVGIWDVMNSMTCVRTVDRLPKPIQSVAFSHDSKIVASCCIDESKIDLTHVETGDKICDLDTFSKYSPIDMEWNPKGYALAVACYFSPDQKVSSYAGRNTAMQQPSSAAVTVLKCSFSKC